LTTHTMLHVQESHSFAPVLVPMAYRSRFAYSYPTNHALTLSAQSARQAIDWVRQETLTDLIPKEDVLAIIDELLSNEALMDDSEELVTKNWEKLERKLREETRPPREILGLETTDRILASVQSMDGYDPQAVNAFLESEAVNSLFSRVLYDGIFEFFQKIDVFGQIINGLPILGPIRKQIVTETKRQLDRSLGPLVQKFLGTYTKIAVREASEFVLSPTNQKAFSGANVKLVSSLLDRPVNSLVPSSDLSEKLRKEIFEYLRSVDMEDMDTYVSFAYDFLGDKSVDNVMDVDKVLDASPTLTRTIDRIWDKAVNGVEAE